jgi:UDP-glucose 4-epimerase
VLGNGKQRKSYLYIQDCIDAIRIAMSAGGTRVAVYNLGRDEYCEVNDSIGWITSHLGLAPALEYSGGDRGWIGDNPFIYLECSRMRALGWAPRLSIKDSVIRTVEYLKAHPWVFEVRP